MKITKLFIFALCMAQSAICFAQWSYTTSGNPYVTSSKKVGIWTNNPLTQLSLGTNANSRKLALYDNNNSWYGLGINPGAMRLQVGNTSHRFAFFAGNSTEVFTIKGSGKVGIKATDPQSDLQVRTGIGKFSAGIAYTSALNWATSYIGFNAARNNGNWKFDGDGANNGGAAIYGTVGGAIFFAARPSSGGGSASIPDADMADEVKMRIYSNGIVAVGDVSTSDNNYLMFIKKGIKTGRVKTDAALADYVFDEDYELMPLSEVESFIWKNKHLPGVISDKEVQANDGVELTSFTISLQEKLEELYLHVIEMEKELKQLKAENASLQDKK